MKEDVLLTYSRVRDYWHEAEARPAVESTTAEPINSPSLIPRVKQMNKVLHNISTAPQKVNLYEILKKSSITPIYLRNSVKHKLCMHLE